MENDQLVVFDTDMVTDDAWALLLLLRAEVALNLFTILAVTAVRGNTELTNVTENIVRLLDSVGRTDIPIYAGSPRALIRANDEVFFFGLDGFGDVFPSIPNYKDYIQTEHAANAMYKLAKKFPKRISFLMAGPLTNLALAITMYDDFLENVKDIWVVGGITKDRKTHSFGYNFLADSVAGHIVLNTTTVPVHLVPEDVSFTAAEPTDLNFRFNYLGAVDNPAIQLLNPAEKKVFVPRKKWVVPDVYLTAAFAFPDVIVESGFYLAYVEPCGKQAGNLTLSRSEQANVHVVEKLNSNYYKRILAWTAGL